MNSGVENTHPSIEYYDSDYPSKYLSNGNENFDGTTKYQGLSDDVQKYIEAAKDVGGPVLELCCGTGRVSIPVAREGFPVTAVDISAGLLAQFTKNLEKESVDVRERTQLVEQDATDLSLKLKDFKLVICAFNSLLCITEFEKQLSFLRGVAGHLADDGLFLLDIVNPLVLNYKGESQPKVFFTRKNVHSGNTYSRIAMLGEFDENQKQELHGWYDEVFPDGTVKRKHYSLFWRPIFRFEIELMLRQVGLKIVKIEGGHLGEKFQAFSPRMFLHIGKQRQ